MNTCMHFKHPPKSYKLDKGIMLIFVSEKNRPLLLAKGVVKYFGIFNQIKNKMTSKLSRELYFALIYSKIKYAIEVYGNLFFHKYE